MMLLLTVIALLATLCCPPTLPIWVFVLVGFHSTVRRQARVQYLARHGILPRVGSADWFRVYL